MEWTNSLSPSVPSPWFGVYLTLLRISFLVPHKLRRKIRPVQLPWPVLYLRSIAFSISPFKSMMLSCPLFCVLFPAAPVTWLYLVASVCLWFMFHLLTAPLLLSLVWQASLLLSGPPWGFNQLSLFHVRHANGIFCPDPHHDQALLPFPVLMPTWIPYHQSSGSQSVEPWPAKAASSSPKNLLDVHIPSPIPGGLSQNLWG